MADTKISDLPNIFPPRGVDELVFARSGTNVKLSLNQLKSSMGFSSTSVQAVGQAVSFAAESEAVFSRMDTLGDAPDDTRKGIINTLVVALQNAGLWAKIDRLYVIAAMDTGVTDHGANGRINWKTPGTDDLAESQGNTATVPLEWTADRGYRGNGASGTAWAMLTSTDGINTYSNYAQDSAHAAVWVQADASGTDGNVYGIVGGGSTFTGWPRVSSGYFRSRTNSSVNFDATNSSGSDVGFFVAVRRGATELESYRNGSSLATASDASVAVPTVNAQLRVCGVGTDASTHRIGFFSVGGALSDTEVSDLYTAVSAYMTSIGA